MKTYFTSDTHYGHKNIIKYSPTREKIIPEYLRDKLKLEVHPSEVITAMDEALIANHNAIVQPDDVIYNLGDFTFHKDTNKIDEIFHRLNGEKHLIVGNHDSPYVLNLPWKSKSFLKEVHVDGRRIVLCHYAMRVWNKSHHGALQLYGHSHGSLPGSTQSVDVGVDGFAQYFPVNLEQILREMKSLRAYSCEDHHGKSGRP